MTARALGGWGNSYVDIDPWVLILVFLLLRRSAPSPPQLGHRAALGGRDAAAAGVAQGEGPRVFLPLLRLLLPLLPTPNLILPHVVWHHIPLHISAGAALEAPRALAATAPESALLAE